MGDVGVFLPLYYGMAWWYGSHSLERLGEQPRSSAGPSAFRPTPELAVRGSGVAEPVPQPSGEVK
jgi:hypothetical protein